MCFIDIMHINYTRNYYVPCGISVDENVVVSRCDFVLPCVYVQTSMNQQ